MGESETATIVYPLRLGNLIAIYEFWSARLFCLVSSLGGQRKCVAVFRGQKMNI